MVLIADDEQGIREIVKMKLEASGFEVREAADGEKAINLAREIKPDIILLDIVMPGIDGIKTFLDLKSDDRTKRIKIFLFTGKGDPRPEIVEINRRFAKESGAVDFIRKEINLDDLAAKLRKIIEDIKAEKEHKNKK